METNIKYTQICKHCIHFVPYSSDKQYGQCTLNLEDKNDLYPATRPVSCNFTCIEFKKEKN